MKTKLYKMWLNFCSAKCRHLKMGDPYSININVGMQEYGWASWNYSYDNVILRYGSKDYYAWNAFMHAKDPDVIVQFIVKHIKTFSNDLPRTAIFLDLNKMTCTSILKKCNKTAYKNLRNAVYLDAKDIDSKKEKRKT